MIQYFKKNTPVIVEFREGQEMCLLLDILPEGVVFHHISSGTTVLVNLHSSNFVRLRSLNEQETNYFKNLMSEVKENAGKQ